MFGKDRITKISSAKVWLAALAGFALSLSPLTAAAAVPQAVISSLTTVNAPGLGIYQVNVAIDACGNFYTMQSGSIYYPYSAVTGGQVTEIPAGGGTPKVVIPATGANYDTNYLWMDSAKANLYINEGTQSVIKVPITNCVLQTSSESTFSIGNLGAVSYYWNASAFATDTAGDIFIGTNVDCCGSGNELVEETPGSAAGTTLLVSLANPVTSIAIDAANNLYYTSGGSLFELPYSGTAYAATPVSFGGAFSSAVGVAFDAAGNLYVGDGGANTIYEIPYETSALNVADRFIVSTNAPISSTPAIDAAGNIFFTSFYTPTNGSTIYEVAQGSAAFAAATVGVSATSTLNVVFNAAVTPAAINFVTAPGVYATATGGTCAAGSSYAAKDTCTINVSFTPAVPGLNSGAVVLADSTGAAIASASLSGTGLGAGLTVDPGVGVALGSGLKTPTGVAIDLAGDVFLADSTNSAVYEVLPGNPTPVALGAGLNAPTGVAVDAAGNVYIADTGNNQVVRVPVINGALNSNAQSIIVSGSTSIAGSTLSAPSGLTIDTGGNLYIADTGNNRVVYLPRNGDWDVANAFTLGSGFAKPQATAVTPSGIIYIADTGNGKIYSLPYASPAAPKTLVAAGYTQVTALATDAAGDLFVVDAGNTLISRIPNIGGALVTASALNITGAIANPYGLALDPAGNLYATDNVNAAAYSVSRTSATQDFGKWNPNTTSNTLSFLLENSGNQPLTFGSPFDTLTGNTAVFTPVTPSTSPCGNGATVAVGADCVLEAKFTPNAFGDFSETLTFSSNAKNTATPQATFTGTGATTLSTTTTLAITSPTGNPYYGQPIQLAVTVSASSGTPSGSVALLVDGLKTTTAVLVDGATTFTLPTGLSGGAHTLQASYLGADTGFIVYSQSQSAVLSTTVTRVATTTTVSVQTLYTNPASQPAGTALTLTAIVGSTFNGIPSGTVTFLINDSAAPLQRVSAPVVAASGGVLEATYSYTPIAPASGTVFDSVTVAATYSGDGNFNPSSSPTSATFDVSPSTGSIGITPSSSAITATATGSSSITYTANSYGGWSGYVGFHCLASTLPANAICVFSPGQVNVLPSNANTSYPAFTTQLSVLVNNPPNSPSQSNLLWWTGGIFGIALFFTRRRLVRSGVWTTTIAVLACLLCLGAAGGLSGCGGGASFVTPKGASSVTVVADSDIGAYVNGTFSGGQCPVNPTTGQADPTQYPCSEQTFSVNLTVK